MCLFYDCVDQLYRCFQRALFGNVPRVRRKYAKYFLMRNLKQGTSLVLCLAMWLLKTDHGSRGCISAIHEAYSISCALGLVSEREYNSISCHCACYTDTERVFEQTYTTLCGAACYCAVRCSLRYTTHPLHGHKPNTILRHLQTFPQLAPHILCLS